MINRTNICQRIAYISIILTVFAGTLVFALFHSSARVEVNAGGASGRLIVTTFGGQSIYAIDADPNIGLQSFDMVTNYPGNPVIYPSVANNGTIAFGFRGPGDDNYRVWAMDADGSNRRQLTFTLGVPMTDQSPVISPDGTKVAFISKRFDVPTFGDGSQKGPEVFVVNIDGSDLQQVTPSEQEPQHGSNPNTFITDFGWDSSGSLIVAGARVVPGEQALKYGLFRYNANGSGQTTLNLLHPAYGTSECFDVRGGKILFGNSNRLFVFNMSGGQIGQVDGTTFNEQILGHGSARLSPDGSKIGYMSRDNNGSLVTMNQDGSGRVTVRNNLGIGANPFWWAQGGPIPTPGRLELTPGVLQIPNDGASATINPALYDVNGNLIFRSAQFAITCDATHPCNVPFNPSSGFQLTPFHKITLTSPSTTDVGYITVCGTNRVSSCSIVALNRDINFAEIRSSVPTVNTNGAGGDGVFTIRRFSTQTNTSFAVDLSTGGTAVRDLDYSLNVSGNNVVIPAGQNTVDVRVTPLRAAGNKTVSLSITAPPSSGYFTVAGQDTATINIVDNGSAPTDPTLNTITPRAGGNGGILLTTIYGTNIRPGANFKLTRSGETDIPGLMTNVAASGISATTVFDLNGQEVGNWDVVVSNTDNSTATITNGFAIAADEPALLQVEVVGPEEVRASHNRSHYDIIYSNRGNTDVFGVMMWITGVSNHLCDGPNDFNCTFIETPIGDIPDVPGQAPFPQYVRQMPKLIPVTLPPILGTSPRQAGVIPVFIPRLPANSSGVFRFTQKFTILSETGFMQIGVSLAPPLVKAVSVSERGTPTIKFVPSRPDDDVITEAGVCLSSVFQSAVNCAIGFVPGEDCLRAGLALIQGVAGVAGNAALQGGGAVNPLSGSQIFAGIVSAGACAVELSPFGALANIALNAVACAANAYDTVSTCIDAHNRLLLRTVASADPNEKVGNRGATSENYISGDGLQYGISFENLPTASAPAQDVVITDQLDISRLDLETFSLGAINFGDTFIEVPPGLKNYSTEADLRPANDLLVQVSAQLDQNTGLVTWQFHSIDPFTRQPPTSALAGFLPPNVNGQEGIGKVLFSIEPKQPLIAGTEIRNSARIIFDLNAPIDTNEWLNTIDNSKPVSSVSPLSAQQSSNVFTIDWSGTDTGSGIKDYTVYVSEDGGPFEPIEVYSLVTSLSFSGEYDTTYSFYTIARDKAGNVEGAKIVGDATTHTPEAPNFTITGTVTYGNAVSGPAPPRYVSNVLISGEGSPSVSAFTGAPGAGAGIYSLGGFGSGSYTVTPTKTGGVNQISSFDAAKVAQHAAGVSSLTGNQLVVADVSGNGSVSSFDAGQIANYVVSGSPVGSAGTWRFSPVNRTYASITSSITGEDFSALLMGEVSGNWNNTGARPVGERQSSGVSESGKSIVVNVPNMLTTAGSEVVIPVEVQEAANKGIISYEFTLRYDSSVLQPAAIPVDLTGTVSSELSFAVNAEQPGILKVAVYGALPIDADGILLNLRFTVIGKPGSTSRLSWTHLMFNEDEMPMMAADGNVKLSKALQD